MSVSAKYRLKYIDIGQNAIYWLNIGQNESIGIDIVTNMLVLIYWYRQKYLQGEYIGISWTHIGPTLFSWQLDISG